MDNTIFLAQRPLKRSVRADRPISFGQTSIATAQRRMVRIAGPTLADGQSRWAPIPVGSRVQQLVATYATGALTP